MVFVSMSASQLQAGMAINDDKRQITAFRVSVKDACQEPSLPVENGLTG